MNERRMTPAGPYRQPGLRPIVDVFDAWWASTRRAGLYLGIASFILGFSIVAFVLGLFRQGWLTNAIGTCGLVAVGAVYLLGVRLERAEAARHRSELVERIARSEGGR